MQKERQHLMKILPNYQQKIKAAQLLWLTYILFSIGACMHQEEAHAE